MTGIDHGLCLFTGRLNLSARCSESPKRIDADWFVDLKFEQYGQRSFWKLSGGGSTGLAPFDARSIQFGITRLF
jgi:hypothetical protein